MARAARTRGPLRVQKNPAVSRLVQILGPLLAGFSFFLFARGCFSLFGHPSISAERGCARDGASARGASALAEASLSVCNA